MRSRPAAFDDPVHPTFWMAGRSRWRVPGLRRNPVFALVLGEALSKCAGLLHAFANPLTGRVLILCDPFLTLRDVREILAGAVADCRRAIGRIPVGTRALPLSRRKAQLEEISGTALDPVILEEERKANRDLAIALASLGAATGALMGFPLLAAASVAGFVYVTRAVYKEAFQTLQRGQVNISTLITITAIIGLAGGHYWIFSYSAVIFPISRKLLLRIQDRSRRNLVDVFRCKPAHVRVRVAGAIEIKAFENLRSCEILLLQQGDTLAADGEVVEGNAVVDEQVLTGESRPVEKMSGESVLAMTRVLSGDLVVRVKATGADTVVGRIGEILKSTATFESEAQSRAEALAERTVTPTLIAGCMALPFLGLRGGAGILNAHFRYKVSAIAPLGVLTSLNIASSQGILIKDGRTLDLLNEVDTVVFDKTGTLTAEPRVGCVHPRAHYTEAEILTYAAAAESEQTHPFASAIIRKAQELGLSRQAIDDEVECLAGHGLRARLNGCAVGVGSLRFMEEIVGIEVPSELRQLCNAGYSQGNSVVLVAVDSKVAGGIELVPTIRPEAKHVIGALRSRPAIRSIQIISGDHEAPTRTVAKYLGIDAYHAGILPESKAEVIADLQAQGRRVCYVGDGINDSIALKRSNVSVSLRGASSIATDTAQIVLMDGSLSRLDRVFSLSDSFTTKMNRTVAMVIAPTVVGMLGTVFLGFGLGHTVLLSKIAMAGGVWSALAPGLSRYE